MNGVIGDNQGVDSLAFGNEVYVAAGENVFGGEDFAFRSVDGETWSAIEGLDNITSVNFTGGEFWKTGNVSGGVGLEVSGDGLEWESVPLPDNNDFNRSWNAIVYGGQGFVMVGNGAIAHSEFGGEWNLVFGPEGYDITWVDWAQNRYFAGAPGPANGGSPLLMSVNGTDWVEVTDEAFTALRTFGAARGNGIFGIGAVFPGFQVTPVYSEFARDWVAAPTIDVRSPRSVLFAGGLFFLMGSNVATSADMQSFTIEPIAEALGTASFSAQAGVVVGDRIQVMVVDTSDDSYSLLSAELAPPEPGEPYLTEGAESFGDDWYYQPWLGNFNTATWPWVFGQTLGWYYAGTESNTLDGSWFYMTHPVLDGWYYFSENVGSWTFGQPTGQAEGWWFILQENDAGIFYLFSQDGSIVIPSES